MSKGFTIKINFLLDKQISIKNALLYANFSDADEDWVFIDKKTIISYDVLVFRIKDIETNTFRYFFGENVNASVEDNEITIDTISKKVFYKQIKVKNPYVKQLKEINKKISSLEAAQLLGITFDRFLELKELKREKYFLYMKNLLRLREEE